MKKSPSRWDDTPPLPPPGPKTYHAVPGGAREVQAHEEEPQQVYGHGAGQLLVQAHLKEGRGTKREKVCGCVCARVCAMCEVFCNSVYGSGAVAYVHQLRLGSGLRAATSPRQGPLTAILKP